MRALVYSAVTVGIIGVGVVVVWALFHFGLRGATGEARRPRLALRVCRAGLFALFLTPSLAGWLPVPFILAVAWTFTGGTYQQRMDYLQGIAKGYLIGWAVVFALIEALAYLRMKSITKV